MPVIKSAKKKLRQDRTRTLRNKKLENLLKKLEKLAKKTKLAKHIKEAIRITDKAAKKRIIHKNKAARIKSSLSHSLFDKSRKNS